MISVDGESQFTEEELEEQSYMGEFHAERIAKALNELPWTHGTDPWDSMYDFDSPAVYGDLPDNFFDWGINTDPDPVTIDQLIEASALIVTMLKKAGYGFTPHEPRIFAMGDRITFRVNGYLDL